jgi:signal transduction histidine kinase
MASRDHQRGRLTILAATLLLIGTGIFAGAAYSLGLPGWYRALLLGVAAVMVLSAGALVLRTLSLERGLRRDLPAPNPGNPAIDRPGSLAESVSRLAHDIRNSLAGLSGVIEILGRDLPAASGGKEVIEEARREIRHIDEAVADFRARVETRTANPEPTGAGSPVKGK